MYFSCTSTIINSFHNQKPSISGPSDITLLKLYLLTCHSTGTCYWRWAPSKQNWCCMEFSPWHRDNMTKLTNYKQPTSCQASWHVAVNKIKEVQKIHFSIPHCIIINLTKWDQLSYYLVGVLVLKLWTLKGDFRRVRVRWVFTFTLGTLSTHCK